MGIGAANGARPLYTYPCPSTPHTHQYQRKEYTLAKKLYVANLSYDVTENELTQMFTQCGQVLEVTLVKDPQTGVSRGFGFVEMQNDDEARHAVDRMNGYDYRGKQISVEYAKDKPEGAVRKRSSHDREPSGRGRR